MIASKLYSQALPDGRNLPEEHPPVCANYWQRLFAVPRYRAGSYPHDVTPLLESNTLACKLNISGKIYLIFNWVLVNRLSSSFAYLFPIAQVVKPSVFAFADRCNQTRYPYII